MPRPCRRTPGHKFPGGHRGWVTPVPIPNTEVKPTTADGTACAGVWESRSLPGLLLGKPASTDAGFFFLTPARRQTYVRAPDLIITSASIMSTASPHAAKPNARLDGRYSSSTIDAPAGTRTARIVPNARCTGTGRP